jgi:hypothetical protein
VYAGITRCREVVLMAKLTERKRDNQGNMVDKQRRKEEKYRWI